MAIVKERLAWGLRFWPRCLDGWKCHDPGKGELGEKFGELRKEIGPGDGN